MWVAAATGAGQGNFSEVSQSRTFGDVPVTMVTLENLTASCPAGLLVEWVELDTKGFRGPESEIRIVVNYTSLASEIRNTTSFNYDGSTVSRVN